MRKRVMASHHSIKSFEEITKKHDSVIREMT